MQPGALNLTLPKRVPFLLTVEFEDLDFTGATFLMEVRNRTGDQGPALIALGNAASNAEGVSVAVEQRIVDGLSRTVSVVKVRINETTLEGLPYQSPTERPLTLAYDLHVTATGLSKRVWLAGSLTIMPGTTI